MPDEFVELKVEDPTPRCFSITCPKIFSAKDFEYVKEQIEFRRKCMNQGFDNLIELLNMSRAALVKRVPEEELEREAFPQPATVGR